MTPKKKLFSLLGLIAVFFIAIPILILFSLGYRLDSRLRLVKTGGIYLADIGSDAIVMINGKNIEQSGVFEKNILIRNLVPKIYYVRIEKDGFRPWKKNVKVLEQKVEVCYPLLLPLKPEIKHIPKYIFKAENKKKKKRNLNEEYSKAIKIFRTYNDPVKSLIPGWENSDIKKYRLNANRRLYKKVFLSRQGNKIYGKWTGMDDKRPFFINSAEGKLIYSSDKNILSFGFFPGRNDSILVLLENLNLYAVEIDTRFEIQNIYLIATNCSSFAAINEFLYYFSAGALFRVDLES
ncbi:MAG: hypothetical protein JXN64_13695 [Spirochaetes bacterium]|nr:hypothetical protein [Spirochaetota bacterium]